MIKISHLKKNFGDFAVLDDVSLHVEKGDIYGILGLSGAGKSTLIRCINGLETPDSGEIHFADELIFGENKQIDRKQRRKITMIFQQFNLLQQINVLKNVDIALSIDSKQKTYDKEEVKRLKQKHKSLLKSCAKEEVKTLIAIKQALTELQAIKEAKPSEALKELEQNIKDRIILAEDRQLKLCATIKKIKKKGYIFHNF